MNIVDLEFECTRYVCMSPYIFKNNMTFCLNCGEIKKNKPTHQSNPDFFGWVDPFAY